MTIYELTTDELKQLTFEVKNSQFVSDLMCQTIKDTYNLTDEQMKVHVNLHLVSLGWEVAEELIKRM